MPTEKPRITITLPHRHHEVLSRLSAASGDSMSQIVAGFVELAIPSLERVVVVMERAKAAPSEVRAGLASAIDRADRHLTALAGSLYGQTDMFLTEAERAVAPSSAPEADAEQTARALTVGRGQRRRVQASAAGSTPVPVTRGSGASAPRPASGKTLAPGVRKGVRRG